MTFARNTPVTLAPSGAHAVVVDTPDVTEAERGLAGHYRVRLDNGTTRLVAADRLRAIKRKTHVRWTVGAAWASDSVEIGIWNNDGAKYLSTTLTEAEAEALVAALQHALAELALAE